MCCWAGVALAQEAGTVDFQGGLIATQPARDGLNAMPGVALELRGYPARHLWLSGGLAVEPTLDLGNPERGELSVLAAAELGAGLFVDVSDRVRLLAGARVDALGADGWPGADDRSYGVRVGPSASGLIVIGHAWGHPMALEARAAWLAHRMSRGDSPGLWQAGLLVSGVLFPDRPTASRP